MASSLLILLDDITAMTKVAAGKTAGVLGDDLALNAEQVTGVAPERELPVVWKVAMGSLRNKFILVPAAMLISTFVPWLVIPLLMIGGLFLCYEGFEKVFHKLIHKLPGNDDKKEKHNQHKNDLANAIVNPEVDMVAFERERIKGAIRTDFVLSAEILVITLGTVAGKPFWTQFAVLSIMAILMTALVYGLVACIVKIDDLGAKMAQSTGLIAKTGRGILIAAPWLMTTLTIVGTAAMFLVGGGILVHGIPLVEHFIQNATQSLGVFTGLTSSLLAGVFGVLAGGLAVMIIGGGTAIWKKLR